MVDAVCTLVSVAAMTHGMWFSIPWLTGTLFFTEQRDSGAIQITGTITGLEPGKHGIHIHEFGDLRNKCMAAGSHFNPAGTTHGAPTDETRHVGDLGNIVADYFGLAEVDITDRVISFSGTNNILGRSVVLHAEEDDLGRGGNEESLRTGNAGARLACCVIEAPWRTPFSLWGPRPSP